MARPKNQHSADIPTYLWQAIDRAAAAKGLPTNRLIAKWLWEGAQRHADDVYDSEHQDVPALLLGLPRPYDRDMGGTREYSRIVKKGESNG